MKLSKTTWLIIAAIVFLVALVGVGRSYLQLVSDRKQVEKQLGAAQTRLKGIKLDELSSNQTDLEKQLSQAESQLEVAKATLPKSLEDVAISSSLFDLAKAHGVEVARITFSGTANETVGGVVWSVTSLTVIFEGDAPHILGLAINMGERFETAIVNSEKIAIPGTDSSENASAEVQLSIYASQGD